MIHDSELRLLELAEVGTNSQQGNLLGLQPYMEIADYRNEEAFYSKLQAYFAQAQKKGWMNDKTIAVLPEYIATWLVVADESPAVTRTASIDLAMFHAIRSNFGSFLKYFLQSPAKDRVKYAIFRMKSQTVLRIYLSVFSRLAREYGITIVAGSVVLPDLDDNQGRWTIKSGIQPLYNSTLVFKPDGSTYSEIVHKVFPTPQELPFTHPGDLERLPVFQTQAGRLGVLNCADSWYGQTYLKLKQKGVDLLAVPSFVDKNQDLHLPWRGNNITPPPIEFDEADFYKITYDDAWIKYALASRYAKADVKNAINVFLRGEFWDMGTDGSSIIIHDGKLVRGKDGIGAAIQSVWLNGVSQN